ncbi:4'-phosphopantetheinyl transferase family protein [Parabacteroides faecis]|uniref:Enterobactin synthase component D n=1 Tax=Parabacteroides faecis TaxID=1217282 RepID=A0ABR6KT56_9BACT|nr:4'-phosphopantetheinyl transferase family protein [Parabacteroides faecis]MBB4624626.1 phosphopantetheinyl transferase [Parabacteroides faecis]GGK12966.1 siderophore biosynthesis protein [Parabacteroides faecis]
MPLLFKHTEPLLGVWKIEESSDELLAMLGLQSEYLPFLQGIKTEKRRQEWLASRVLLKELVGEELLIAYHDDGAPYLSGSSLSLSISHTNGYAAVLLQDQETAGIDIEYHSNRVLKICSRFMSPEEGASIGSEYEVEHLLVYWCAKEALFKMIRQQDIDFIEHLHIEPFQFSVSGKLNVHETKTLEQRSYVLKYEVLPDFVLVYSV